MASLLSSREISELFPDDDPALVGNKVAYLVSMLGIPPRICKGCEERRRWLNAAHIWIKKTLSRNPPAG